MTGFYQETSQPVPVEEFFGIPYSHLYLDEGDERELLEGFLEAAVSFGEMYTKRVFRKTSFTGQFSCFDTSLIHGRPYSVEIFKSPLIEVTALRIQEQGNLTPTVFSPTVVKRFGFSIVTLPADVHVTLDLDTIYPIEIDFTAGYVSDANPTLPDLAIPQSVKMALRQHVAYFYENRGDVKGDFKEGFPDDVKASYAPIKLIHV